MHQPLLSALAFGAALLALAALLFLVRRLLRLRRDRLIAGYDFGNAARLALRQKHPQLSSSELDLAWTALRQYFRICLRAGRRRVPMPSRLADDAWHCLILDTRRYAQFCQAAFGRFLHHVPEQPGAPRLAAPRRRVEKNPAWKLGRSFLPLFGATRLPLLFVLDEQARLIDGFNYQPPDPLRRRTAAGASDGAGCSSCSADSGDASCGDSGGGDSGCGSGCSGGGGD
jgi:hypothetical protein